MFFAPRKSKNTVFAMFFASGDKKHGIHSVFWTALSKNAGIYAVSGNGAGSTFRDIRPTVLQLFSRVRSWAGRLFGAVKFSSP